MMMLLSVLMEPSMLAHRRHPRRRFIEYTQWKQIGVKRISIDPCDDKTVTLNLPWPWPWP